MNTISDTLILGGSRLYLKPRRTHTFAVVETVELYYSPLACGLPPHFRVMTIGYGN